MPDRATSKLRQPGEQLPLAGTCEDTPEAVSEARRGPYRYPVSGLTADEIVALFITEFDAVEVPVE